MHISAISNILHEHALRYIYTTNNSSSKQNITDLKLLFKGNQDNAIIVIVHNQDNVITVLVQKLLYLIVRSS